MKRSLLLASLVTILAATAVGCSDDSTLGNPMPEQTSSGASSAGVSTSTRPSATGSGSAGSVNGPLGNIDPCSLLADSAASGLGLGQGKPHQVSGSSARLCRWQASGSYTVGVVIYDSQGLKDLVGTDRTDLPAIGKHQTVRYVGADNSVCVVAFGITDSSRVDVQAADNRGDMDKACDAAIQVAQRVEPQLP
jgi:Protein of unknown function (DUF3558)